MQSTRYTTIDNNENRDAFGCYVLKDLNWDATLLFASKITRMFSFGFLSVMLVSYLRHLELNQETIGILFTLTLIGDMFISILMTSHADRWSRRNTLMVGALISTVTGIIFAVQQNFWVLLISAIFGVISPSGNECGPFMAIEISCISEVTRSSDRTRLLAWYNLFGCFAAAGGALFCGICLQSMTAPNIGFSTLLASRIMMFIYSFCQFINFFIFSRLSGDIEVPEIFAVPKDSNPVTLFFGLHKSKNIVIQLCVLFVLDSFAGAFILQSLLSAWFSNRFNTSPQVVGAILFVCNIVAGVSALFAAMLADSIGLICTMVVTHLPSNILIILVPLMPTEFLAIVVCCLRFSISQMDVPTRNAYVQGVVEPDERSAANGVTNVVRTLGVALGPLIAERLYAHPATANYPFYVAGGLKIVYDLLLLWRFQAVKPKHEMPHEVNSHVTESPVTKTISEHQTNTDTKDCYSRPGQLSNTVDESTQINWNSNNSVGYDRG